MLPALLGYFTDKNVKLDRYDTVQKSQVTDVMFSGRPPGGYIVNMNIYYY